MSHQTGITASDSLRDFFSRCKDGSIRLIKVAIKNEKTELSNGIEKMELDSKCPPSGTWEEDYDTLILPRLEEKMPCYILYRFDKATAIGYEWLFIAYSPDHAPVRQKMLYASTKATLKKEFGGSQIKDEMFGTTLEDVNFNGYQKHLKASHADAPLTMAEEELQSIKKNEVRADISVNTQHQTMAGLAFPFSEDAIQYLQRLGNRELDYVQLAIDLEKEYIYHTRAENFDVNSLKAAIPTDKARYHFFNFKHTHEGDYLESIVFIYSMPGYKCPIKERMLYSSCKAMAVDVVEQLGIEISRKIEIDDPSEVCEQFIYDEVHPKKDIVRQQFSRPKGPGGRGPRRITKK